MSKSFADQVKAWTQKAEKRMEDVFEEATKEVAKSIIEKAPEKSGFLGHSVEAQKGSIPPIREGYRGEPGATYAPKFAEINGVIEGAKLGDTIGIGVTAHYSRFAEFGIQGHEPNGMVRLTVQDWPMIVEKAVRKVKAKK